MEVTMRAALINWYKAHQLAQECSKIMADPKGDSQVAAQRMQDYEKAEQTIFQLAYRPDAPPELERWFEVQSVRACPRCSLTSGPKIHPECQKIWNSFFAAREALSDFIAREFINA